MSTPLIRSADQSDIPKILPMIAQICALHQAWDSAKYGFLPNPELLYENWLAQLIAEPNNLCLVAETSAEPQTDSRLVAFLIATVEKEIPIYSLKTYGFVHDLWVDAAYRHLGIARSMVQHAIAHFTRLGVQQIRLDTAQANEAARRLFLSCGFRISTIELLMELNEATLETES